MQLIKIIIIAILVRDSKIGEIQNYLGAVPLKSCVFASACTSVRRGWWGSSLAPLQRNMDRQLLSSHSSVVMAPKKGTLMRKQIRKIIL